MTDACPFWHFVNSLAIPLDLAIKDTVFILGQHLGFRWHLGFPALDLLHAAAEAAQCGIEGGHDGVDVAEAFPLAVFLVSR